MQIGAYAPGSNERVDKALIINEPLNGFLRQARTEKVSFGESVAGLAAIGRLAGIAP